MTDFKADLVLQYYKYVFYFPHCPLAYHDKLLREMTSLRKKIKQIDSGCYVVVKENVFESSINKS